MNKLNSPQLSIPRHVAIIMDGNGRWAQQRNLPRAEGHRQGAKSVRSVVRRCRERGVEALTLYAFATQNWGRPSDEISSLMNLLEIFLTNEASELIENEIRLTSIGDLSRIPSSARESMESLCRKTAQNSKMTLCLALSYGGREEIVGAVRNLAERVANGDLNWRDIQEETLAGALQTHEIPADPDLMIRTSGELRLSNFLLWQSAYAELYFTDTLWPDFGPDELDKAIENYRQRERRFGVLPELNTPHSKTQAPLAKETEKC